MDAIFNGLGAALGFAALHAANDYIFKPQDLGCLCPPLGAVAVLLFSMPMAPASQPKAVIGGHLIAGAVSCAVVMMELPQYGEMAAVALTITLMSMLEMTHPPAGAYAFLYVNKGMKPIGMLAPGLAGACVLICTQQVFLRIKAAVLPKLKKH
eukprot:CAMPEP_0185729534 /NCGR_PEP_ID=MMETSP1171-20130828/6309_1 /TAXON_ID=374046 /ORGANISM="Helicotheca tamensis, Strain CCMP826" /LENGTH=152 /DNA_ID=CAMNT_0028398403 /DNA_START=98 /DNA_END=556 /DNA_ORIENTATION=+